MAKELVPKDEATDFIKIIKPGDYVDVLVTFETSSPYTSTILQNVKSGEAVEIDFKGVLTFSPSWGAEFLMPLLKKYGDNLILKNTRNGSVQSTLEFLEQIENKKFMRYNK